MGTCWYLLAPVGTCWHLLVLVGTCWYLLVPVGVIYHEPLIVFFSLPRKQILLLGLDLQKHTKIWQILHFFTCYWLLDGQLHSGLKITPKVSVSHKKSTFKSAVILAWKFKWDILVDFQNTLLNSPFFWTCLKPVGLTLKNKNTKVKIVKLQSC